MRSASTARRRREVALTQCGLGLRNRRCSWLAWLALRHILGLLARTALDVFLAIAERGLQLRIRLVRLNRHHLLHGPTGVLIVVEFYGGRAAGLAVLLVTLEMVGERGKANGEVIAVAQAHAQSPVSRVAKIAVLAQAAF